MTNQSQFHVTVHQICCKSFPTLNLNVDATSHLPPSRTQIPQDITGPCCKQELHFFPVSSLIPSSTLQDTDHTEHYRLQSTVRVRNVYFPPPAATWTLQHPGHRPHITVPNRALLYVHNLLLIPQNLTHTRTHTHTHTHKHTHAHSHSHTQTHTHRHTHTRHTHKTHPPFSTQFMAPAVGIAPAPSPTLYSKNLQRRYTR